MNDSQDSGPFDEDLPRRAANFVPLTPLSFLERAGRVHATRPAYAYGRVRRSWGEVALRCRRLAAALAAHGIARNDTVAFLAPNVPALFEAQFGVAMAGAVVNPINIRLDAGTIRFILEHGEAKALFTDTRFAPAVREALAGLGREILVVDIDDTETDEVPGERLGTFEYEAFLEEGGTGFVPTGPRDEWDAISLNYTSGTTSDPKGVVVHHRGAYLMALGTAAAWPMVRDDEGRMPVHMYVVPLFHCNGWGHAWALAAQGGMSVLVRNITAANLFAAIAQHRVTHFGGAPIVLSMLINAAEEDRRPFDWPINVYTAAAPPPPSVLDAFAAMGFRLTHVYGLTETYGHVTECLEQAEWGDVTGDARAALHARQGVGFNVLEGAMVADPETMEPVPADGRTIGEIMLRGNVVMKGYLKNPSATEAAFEGGWFRSGDLAVMHADGYLQIRDRSKDIIISGGENISSVEIEGVIARHDDVALAAVVARPDEKWGETPAAFVELKPGRTGDAEAILAHCRAHLAGFKMPKSVTFGELPKTSTGKIQKFVLRKRIAAGDA